MSTIVRLHPAKRYSEASVHNGTVYLTGQVADDATQDISGQTAQVLAAIDRLLADAGSDKKKILMAQIFLADMADYAGMNATWDAWVAARRLALAGDRAGSPGQARVARRGGRHRGDLAISRRPFMATSL